MTTDPNDLGYRLVYYSYLGPGKDEFSSNGEFDTHKALSYYFKNNGHSAGNSGLTWGTSSSGYSFYNAVSSSEKRPPADTYEFTIEDNDWKSYTENGVVRTKTITFNADSRLTGSITLASGQSLYFEDKAGDTGAHTGTVSLTGGDKFYVTANSTFLSAQGSDGQELTSSYSGSQLLQPWVATPTGSAAGNQAVLYVAPRTVNANFTLEWEGNGKLKLTKSISDADGLTKDNKCYSLEGTVYTVYSNAECTKKAKDLAGKDATLTVGADGTSNELDMLAGDYWVKETTAGRGLVLDSTIHQVTVAPGKTAVVTAEDAPVSDPVNIALTKQSNETKVGLQGAIYCVEFYPGIQTYNETEAKNNHSGSVSKWYLKTDTNGRAMFDAPYLASGYTQSSFYMNLGIPQFPLGTVVIYEEQAPTGYLKSPKHFVYKVLQESMGSGNALLYKEGKNGEDVLLTGGIQEENSPVVADAPIKVDVELTKGNANTNPRQGNTGDLSVEGAVYALYARRDVVDPASGEVDVPASGSYAVKTAIVYPDGTPVVDRTTGQVVWAEAGDKIPVAIFPPTDADGKTKLEDLYVAKQKDDYYVVELAAPKGFYRDHNPIEVDLRDKRTDTQKQDVNYKSIDATVNANNNPIEQPLHVKKYEYVEEGQHKGIEGLNGAEFRVFLISSLKDQSFRITNGNGSTSYNFANYDFSKEQPIIVTADGGTALVTGSDGGDDGEVVSIPLMPGEYVVVETKTPAGLEPVEPIVISMPKYKVDVNGDIVPDKDREPTIYATNSISPLNAPVEQYLKINKLDANTSDFVLDSEAVFSIWDVSGSNTSLYKDDPSAYGKRVAQDKQTENGMVNVDEFKTNSEGYLVLYEPFGYGEYAVVEEKAPDGYDKADPVFFSVRSEGVYLWFDNRWVKAGIYTNTTATTVYSYWEVVVSDTPFELNLAKNDAETGDWVPDAELTIYKALDSEGHLAVDEDGNPAILEARDESGEKVQAVWNTSEGFKHFEVVPAGWYVIRETKAPVEAGYATMDDVTLYVGNDDETAPDGIQAITGDDTILYSFEKRDGGVVYKESDSIEVNAKKQEVALRDKPITVSVSKVDATDGNELPGAELTLYRIDEDDDVLIDTWVSGNEPHVVKYLQPGRYKLYENTVPLGYRTEQDTIEFDVEDSQVVQKCDMVNHPIVVRFSKESSEAEDFVEGATLALYRVSDGPARDESRDEDGSSNATPSDADDSMQAEETTIEEAETEEASTETDAGTDENYGTLVERWVTDGTVHVIEKLYPGDYLLVEEKTPYGYTKSKPIAFTVSDHKEPESVIMYDEPIKCWLIIDKHGEVLTSASTQECEYGSYVKLEWEDAAMEGVEFDITDEDGNLVEKLVTDETGKAYSKQLDFGVYKVKEIVPDGYVDKRVVYTVEYEWSEDIETADLVGTLTVDNEACNTQVNVYKTGEGLIEKDGKYSVVETPLPKVLFGIYADEEIKDYSGNPLVPQDTCVGYAVTDSAGIASFNVQLLRGKYYYRELKTAGPEYVPDEENHKFEIVLKNNAIDSFNLNETTPLKNKLVRGFVRVYKIDANTEAPLADAKFDVYDSKDVLWGSITTGSDGYAMIDELPYGDYYLVETEAPKGYQRVDTKFKVSVRNNNEIATVTISNKTVPKLGDFSIVIIAGFVMIASGFITAIVFRRKG
ncbi:MAG: SpaA isopeptide-forming pilin-related protein [Ruminococcus sp.]|nr:SpaA isopeptide-forming pilin-related protein [Ruminococcus sp.]